MPKDCVTAPAILPPVSMTTRAHADHQGSMSDVHRIDIEGTDRKLLSKLLTWRSLSVVLLVGVLVNFSDVYYG